MVLQALSYDRYVRKPLICRSGLVTSACVMRLLSCLTYGMQIEKGDDYPGVNKAPMQYERR